MSSGSGVGNIIAISGLAATVFTAYKDAPADGCRQISKEVAALQILIDKVAQYFKSANISSGDRHDGQKILTDCQNVLEDLNSLMEKYRRLVCFNRRLAFMGVKLRKEDITTLRERLISSTILVNGFIRRFAAPTFPLHYGY